MAEEFLSLIFAFPNPLSVDFTTAFDNYDKSGMSFLLPEDEWRDMLAMYMMMPV